ncbi:hypothetical protein J2X31_003621 [Flavobacterium arsenatis]|uniref:Uncharacterized protein n=1 Tax=Flavobacterium arsenatis TaxID=1484332 RepID=A0ABU1TUQ4_9FLAO|nr:hypothetical protein [Flavobacterium arsenatis]MDR6969588.1 hypothetical protein [Flavobacterium arsenatis]
MKKHLFFAYFFVCTLQLSAQKNQEEILIASFLELNSKETNEDEVALNQAVQKFDEQLIYTLENYDITSFKTFEKGLDSLYTDFSVKKAETGNFELFTLRNGFDRWNYVLKDKKVVMKALKTFDYFYEIHTLSNNEFLLIKRMDEMSFSCFEAFVYHQNLHNSKPKTNILGNKVLSVCSWTNVDESYPGKTDPETGLQTVEGGLKIYEPLEIKFNPKKKNIYYTFYRLKDGKKITRKAKYRNGSFKIKSYDARTFEE